MLTGKWLHITTGVLASALIWVLALICLNEPMPRSRRVQRPSMFVKSSEQYVLSRKKESPKKVEDRPKFTLSVMKSEVLNIAPEVYYSVRLELEGGGRVSERNPAHTDLESLAIKFVEVFTKSHSWDRLKSQEKIDLLYRTFMFLNRRCPSLSRFVRLAFDDGRQGLEFKFDDVQKMVPRA